MARVSLELLHMNSVFYEQRIGDSDYGSCLWAKFYFDAKLYSLLVVSDCGNFAYKWTETPRTESFMDLMRRCSGGYILDKISEKTVIDEDHTFRNLVSYLFPDQDLSDVQHPCIERLQEACKNYDHNTDLILEVCHVLDDYAMDFETYELWECISYDYPVRAKKIAEIFETHIQPCLFTQLKG